MVQAGDGVITNIKLHVLLLEFFSSECLPELCSSLGATVGYVPNVPLAQQDATWCRQVGRAEVRYANLREGCAAYKREDPQEGQVECNAGHGGAAIHGEVLQARERLQSLQTQQS